MINNSPLFSNEHPSISLILNNINQKKIQDIKGFLEGSSDNSNNFEQFKSFVLEKNQANSFPSKYILCYEAILNYKQSFVTINDNLEICTQLAQELVSMFLLYNSPYDLGNIDNSTNTYGLPLKSLIEYMQPALRKTSTPVKPAFMNSNSLFGSVEATSSLFDGILSSPPNSSNTIISSSLSFNNTNITTSSEAILSTSPPQQPTVQPQPPKPSFDFTSVITLNLFDSFNDYLLLKLDVEFKKYQNREKELQDSNSNTINITNINNNIDPLNLNSSSNNINGGSLEDSQQSQQSQQQHPYVNNLNSTMINRKQYNIQTLEGERLESEPVPVYYMDILGNETIPSILFITNFRVIFISKLTLNELSSMPLATIYRVDKVSNFKVDHTISIWGKNFRRLDFFIIPRELYPNTSAEIYQSGDFTYPLISKIRNFAFHENFFAYKFKYNIPTLNNTNNSSINGNSNSTNGNSNNNINVDVTISNSNNNNNNNSGNNIGGQLQDLNSSSTTEITDGWRIHDFFREFMRQGLLKEGNSNWRFTIANLEYLNPTYPDKLIVPADITDDDVIHCMGFRSKGRIPALSWISTSGVPLARSSQPMVGITRQKNIIDERLVNGIRQACPTNKSLYLLDARPKANAIANVAKGMGYELNYDCNIEFLGIANIHSMRESYNKLEAFCQSNNDDNWLNGFEQTKWWEYLRILLSGSARSVQMLQLGHPVLLHCSDGWDRTSQLSSLSMIMMDPYFRTIDGFQVLIEKEWLSFGHNFQNRVRHGDRNYYSESQRSPIFQQFIDCVFQLLNQHPDYFEFNDEYLIAILDALYSCQFGTFLGNSEKERCQIKGKTVSLWTYLNTIKDQFINVFYQPEKSVPFNILDWKAEHIVLWKNYYQRYWRSNKEPINYHKISVDLKLKVKDLETQIKELKLQLQQQHQNGNTDNTTINDTNDVKTENLNSI